MKTLEELRQYYNTTLLPELRVLEQERKKSLNKIILSAAIIIPLAVLLTYISKHHFPAILGIIGIFGVTWVFTREYVSKFKTGIIEKIVTCVDENLKYSKNGRIPQNTFAKSKIFKHRIDSYKGDDYVRGRLGQTEVEFSEIHAQYVTRDSKGRKSYHTIFKGLFFVADFNKEFKGVTIVLPDVAEKMLGGLGTMFQSWNKGRGQLVKLEDPEFEKMFVVYGEDQVGARYILSMSLMRRITDFKNKTKRQIHLSFIRSHIFIAISYRRDLFEPRIFRTLLSFVPIQQYFDDLQLAV
ncbi:MAG: DUF3137 domain-containing protein, partial [Candidatus Omnitrophica bacterium]|nr:DUF3137 domain-containing protein [Candidatus Omnitrophota bacterium]